MRAQASWVREASPGLQARRRRLACRQRVQLRAALQLLHAGVTVGGAGAGGRRGQRGAGGARKLGVASNVASKVELRRGFGQVEECQRPVNTAKPASPAARVVYCTRSASRATRPTLSGVPLAPLLAAATCRAAARSISLAVGLSGSATSRRGPSLQSLPAGSKEECCRAQAGGGWAAGGSGGGSGGRTDSPSGLRSLPSGLASLVAPVRSWLSREMTWLAAARARGGAWSSGCPPPPAGCAESRSVGSGSTPIEQASHQSKSPVGSPPLSPCSGSMAPLRGSSERR